MEFSDDCNVAKTAAPPPSGRAGQGRGEPGGRGEVSGCGSGETGDCCESAAAAAATFEERVALYAKRGKRGIGAKEKEEEEV